MQTKAIIKSSAYYDFKEKFEESQYKSFLMTVIKEVKARRN